MAKSHIKFLARKLVDKYDEVEQLTAQLGEQLKDTMFSPEEQTNFSVVKGAVDKRLSEISVALSAAAQGKIRNLILQIQNQKISFTEPLHKAIDDLASDEIPDELKEGTQSLIRMYTKSLQQLEDSEQQLLLIEQWATIPSSKKKQRKLLKFNMTDAKEMSLADRVKMLYGTSYPFEKLDIAIKDFKEYIETLSNEGEEASKEEDDLNE